MQVMRGSAKTHVCEQGRDKARKEKDSDILVMRVEKRHFPKELHLSNDAAAAAASSAVGIDGGGGLGSGLGLGEDDGEERCEGIHWCVRGDSCE
jgi:hypothetical protein